MEVNWLERLRQAAGPNDLLSSIPELTDNILKVYEDTWQTSKENRQADF